MRYELVILLDKEEEIKTIEELLKKMEIKIINQEKWGQKTLAYPIKKKNRATYFNYLLEIDKKIVSQLRQKLNFNNNILRFLLLKVNN